MGWRVVPQVRLVRALEDGGCPQALMYGIVCPQGRGSHVCSPVAVVLVLGTCCHCNRCSAFSSELSLPCTRCRSVIRCSNMWHRLGTVLSGARRSWLHRRARAVGGLALSSSTWPKACDMHCNSLSWMCYEGSSSLQSEVFPSLKKKQRQKERLLPLCQDPSLPCNGCYLHHELWCTGTCGEWQGIWEIYYSISHATETFPFGNVPTRIPLLYSHNGRDLGVIFKWLYPSVSAASLGFMSTSSQCSLSFMNTPY